jgi:hypothetical protein
VSGGVGILPDTREVVVGSESGRTRYELSRGYARVLPDIYAFGQHDLSLRDRTVAAWLWSKRRRT